MKKVSIPDHAFESEASVHHAFAQAMGFPDFYGKNWDAWIDCMSYIDDAKVGMSKVTVGKGESLEIEILVRNNSRYYEGRVWGVFCGCMAAVNARLAAGGSKARLVLTEKHG